VTEILCSRVDTTAREVTALLAKQVRRNNMKKFIGSKTGGNILGVALALTLFFLIGYVFGIGGAIGGAIAGAVGFGVGGAISAACGHKDEQGTPEEKQNPEE